MEQLFISRIVDVAFVPDPGLFLDIKNQPKQKGWLRARDKIDVTRMMVGEEVSMSLLFRLGLGHST